MCTTEQKIEFSDAMPDGLSDSDYDELERWYCQTQNLEKAKIYAALALQGFPLQSILNSN